LWYNYFNGFLRPKPSHRKTVARRKQAISVTKLSVFDLLAPYPVHAEIGAIFDGGDYFVDIFKGIANVLIGTVLIAFFFPVDSSANFCLPKRGPQKQKLKEALPIEFNPHSTFN
jgi:hypothetical protein